jgi:hypothetical protein
MCSRELIEPAALIRMDAAERIDFLFLKIGNGNLVSTREKSGVPRQPDEQL